ncbi:MAG TPA: hypothetical protein DCY88_18330, partial [Cyanobacteria bacterium UBA11372]|nr:hypothetical protein [Cyanobacteria bacterium UBA11372]
ASLGDRVWMDNNANGIQDAGESGLAGVTVKLLDNNGNPVLVGGNPVTTTTDTNGNYLFSGLTPGQYKVQFTPPSGYVFTTPDVGTNDAVDSDANTSTGITQTVTLTSGQNNLTLDAGVYQPSASLGDKVWEDSNANGIQDAGEVGVSGVTVTLTSGGADGIINGIGDTTTTATTDANGLYAFTGLTPGRQYQVQFSNLPAGYQFTTADAGADTVDSDANTTTGKAPIVTLAPGENNPTIDAGIYKTATLGDKVWEDSNANGIQDAGEAGISGVTVELYKCVNNAPSGAVLATTLTNANGNYSFTGLIPGDYIVKFITPNGYVQTTANVGADGSDSDAGTGGLTGCYTLVSGQTDNTVDAGFYTPTPGIKILKDANQTFVGPNTPVTYTYSVSNTGGLPLGNINVTDDNATPDFTDDDFNPTAVLGANGKNIGDTNGNNLLDLTEVWKYSATVIPPVVMTVTPTAGGPVYDSGTLSYQTLANGDIRVFYRQDNNFNDNTYGTGSDIGWTSQGKIHKFGDLTGSDKAGFEVRATDGTMLFKFYQDYITASTTNIDGYTSYSGYQSLGFSGGDGGLVTGGTLNGQATTFLKDFDSTIELNLNRPGYTTTIVNSPVGDPNWDVVNGYYFTIDKAAFTSTGKSFGGVTIFDQHNSPAKIGGSNTYIPDIVSGVSVNTATVTGINGTTTVTSSDDASVAIVSGPLGSIGDRVWLDINANGVQDSGETGISGVKVNLTGDFDQNGTIDYTATTTTGANGIYNFTGLPVGEYKVTIDTTTLPVNYIQTYDLDGLSTANSALGDLTSGQNRVDFDFGYVASAPGFSMVKSANKTVAAFGEKVIYTYDVSNTGASALSNVVVKDDNGTPDDGADDFTPTYVSGDNGNGLLDPGEVWKYSATVTPPIDLMGTVNGQTVKAGTLISQTLANGDTRITYRQSTGVNDNTYGTGAAADWPNGHTFDNLVGSDKAGFELKDGNGQVVMKFYMDYITASSTQDPLDNYGSYSGYRSLGVTGGDGSISIGSAANLYDFDSTLELNLNRPGYTTTIVNSPVGDPNWDVVDGYSFTVKAGAFGTAGFGSVSIFDQHNSPSKLGVNSFVPTATGGEVTNTAVVTAKLNGNTVVAVDDATVVVGQSGSSGGNAKFFVVDIGADKTFKYSEAGAGIGNFALQSGNTDPRDVAANADGSKLWVIDKDKNVNVYLSNGTAQGFWKADGAGKESEGIALDGNDLWIADRSRKLFWYDSAASNTTGTDKADKTFSPSMSGNLKGIVTDGNKLWAVTEGGTDYVYRFAIARDAAGNPTGLTQDGVWKLATANCKPTGITIDPTGASQSIWIVDESTDTVYEYANGRSLTSGTGTVSNSFKLASTNLAPQGIADPLVSGGNYASSTDDALTGSLGNLNPVRSRDEIKPLKSDCIHLFDDASAYTCGASALQTMKCKTDGSQLMMSSDVIGGLEPADYLGISKPGLLGSI